MSNETDPTIPAGKGFTPVSQFPGFQAQKPVFGKKTATKAAGMEQDPGQGHDAGAGASTEETVSQEGGEHKAQRASIDPIEHQLEPRQEKAYSDLLIHILRNGQWGYKGITDPTSKEISFQSEKVAERIYGYLYRNNPEKADRLWEEHTGHTPSEKFHQKVKGQTITQNADQALPELQGRVQSITSGIRQLRQNEVDDMQSQQLPQLMHMLGETDQRKIDYRRKALQQTFQNDREHQDNGLAVLKTFGRGLAHGKEGIANWKREHSRGKTINQSIKDVQGNIKQLKNENVRASVNRGDTVNENLDSDINIEFRKEIGKAFGQTGISDSIRSSVSKANIGAVDAGANIAGTMSTTVVPSAKGISSLKNGMDMGTVGAKIAINTGTNMVNRITGRSSVKEGIEASVRKPGIDLKAGMQQAASRQDQGPSLSI